MDNRIVLPQIIDTSLEVKDNFPYLSDREVEYINDAKQLFNTGMYSYAMIAVWDAAVYNLKRKVEAYGTELWESVVKSEPGRKKYNKEGDTKRASIEEFNSNNTRRLNLEETKEKIASLEYIQNELNGIPNLV